MQLAHIKIPADQGFPRLPENRAYAVVLIAHEETTDRWRRGLAEVFAVGSCVQVNIWGQDASEWRDCIEAANGFAVLTEERAEDYPDIAVSSQSDKIIDDVFIYSAAHLQDCELEAVDLLVVLEVGEPALRYDLTSMAHRAAMEYGVQAAMAC